MPQVPDAGAIAQQVKARIKHIEEQLRQQLKLTDELERLRDALSRLEGEARSRVSAVRRSGKPAATPGGSATRTRAAKPASVPARVPRGENKAKLLDALKDGPMTASEVAKATGIATVSTMLTRMVKTGELAKAQRGYRLPQERRRRLYRRPKRRGASSTLDPSPASAHRERRVSGMPVATSRVRDLRHATAGSLRRPDLPLRRRHPHRPSGHHQPVRRPFLW
jgi:hypothetical protein